MKNYVSLERFSRSIGDVGLSKEVFMSLGTHAIDSVKSVMKLTNKTGINLKDEVAVTIKNNRVTYKFDVEIEEGVDENSVRNSITDIVTTNLLMICEAVPFDIETRITTIKEEK